MSASPPALADATLQINLSAGDAAYAAQTVPRLVAAHPGAARRLAVVDCCRPQRTRIFDPATRLPEAAFQSRLDRVSALACDFQARGLFDDIVWLEPGSPHFPTLARRYARPGMTQTHDYGGCAFMSYWAALDFPATRFVIHYDADVVLHQSPGFDWAGAALGLWERYPQVVAASPRISPPWTDGADDAPSRHEGRPLERVADGWLNDWFSTRCFLVDRTRLAPHLPLVRGGRALECALRRLLDRGYPPSPEVVLFRGLGPRGQRRLNLASRDAWMLHPHSKPQAYLALLPSLLDAVAAGRVPDTQRGHSEIDVAAWTGFLGAASSASP